MTLHIVNVSGGMASAECVFRVIDRFGHEATCAVFADTRSEDADTYRFLDDVERVAGIPIARLSDGRGCWAVWFDSFMFTALNGGCRASWELKKKPLEVWMRSVASPDSCVVYVGFGHDEPERCRRLQERRGDWQFDFPLLWKPHLGRCDLSDAMRSRGIEPPRLYASGYPHNNCAGACILAGIAQWCGLLTDNRSLYLDYEEKEQQFLVGLRERGRPEVTILKDRRGGEVRNLSLRQLREEIESGVREAKDTWRASTCSCMGMLF